MRIIQSNFSQNKARTPCLILALEDSGSGRSMEVYYSALLTSSSIQPIMVYSREESYNNAPAWVCNKICSHIPIIDHGKDDCNPKVCKKKYHRTNDDWFTDCIPYIIYLREKFGENCLWVVDMAFPKLEKYMNNRAIQVFHGELFNIGVSYYDRPGSDWGKHYSLIFPYGRHMHSTITKYNALTDDLKKIKCIGRVLNDPLHRGLISREKVLKIMGLSTSKKTILYAPSWESLKVWSIGEKIDDQKNLLRFAEHVCIKLNCNLILRPHTLSLSHHNVEHIYKTVEEKFPATVFFDKNDSYSLLGPNLTLAAADILVTDLSSIAGDFLSLDKPAIFVFPEDKYISSGLWGKYVPRFDQVRKMSYAVRTFKQLYGVLTLLTTRKESSIQKKLRQQTIRFLYASTKGDSRVLFRKNIEQLSMRRVNYLIGKWRKTYFILQKKLFFLVRNSTYHTKAENIA